MPSLNAVRGVMVCLCLFFSLSGFAAQECHHSPVVVTDSTRRVDLTSCLWYLEDPSHEQSIDQIRARTGTPESFQEHHQGVLNFGYTQSAYWVRFDLIYQGDREARDYLLELALPLADEADLYLEIDGELHEERHFSYGNRWADQELDLANPTFILELERGRVVTAYLRVYTQNTFRLPLELWAPEAYAEDVALTELIHGAFLGCMLAIFAYNLFVTLVVRERGYVFYVLYLFFATLFVLTEQVHGQQIFGQQLFFLHKDYLHYWILLAWFWALLMARDLLETRHNAAGLDQVLRLALYGVVTTFFLSLFIRYHVSMQWTVIGSVVLAIMMLIISYRAWQMGIPSARTYFFAWSFVLASVGIYGLTVMGYLPLNTFSTHAPQLGFVTQIILLSFAMAERIKTVQEQALRWNQSAVSNLQRYRSLFNNAIEGIFQMSPRCRFMEANPALAHMLGFSSAKQLLRQSPNVLNACFASDSVRDWVRNQLQATGEIKSVEAAYINRQGGERWASVSLRTVYDKDGVPTHLEGTFIDVTERKHREEVERERENERLEKEVARSSAAAKSQFLANMSHEIRTPLAAIIGYGETLMEPDLDDEEKRNSAETVVRSGRHLLDLINDILDHSKIDANKLDVEFLTVSLPELLDEVRAFFASRARERGLEFSIACEYPLPETICTDPTRFRQILINLCGNALKFTEKGSIHVAVRCERESRRLVARIVDTGIGMKPEQLERLFDPFAQASSAIARQYGGTGLGLSISKRLSELLGGAISVTSTYGEGSEFEVSIDCGPLDGVHFIRDASEMTQRRRQLPMVETPQLEGRILCAEDNEVNRKLVELLVSRTGAAIVHVGNGAEALEVALQDSFDLILMDIQMPVMNGRDATRALREAGVNTPIIALTANVMAEDIQDYRDAGCTDFLAKPIDKGRFYEALARFLRITSDGRSAVRPSAFRGTVLVAEDNPDNLLLVERLLARAGVEVLSADTGAKAVQLAMGKTVQLVLMDSHMPEMNGPDATRLLRQTGFRRPIIAFTAGDQREIDELRAAGCDGILTKPIDSEHLQALLQKYLEPEDPETAPVHDPEDDAIAALIQQFVAGLPERLRIMQRALHESDWERVQSQAHQIKGTAGAMGYPLMTERAGELERAIKRGDHKHADTLLLALEKMISHALARAART